MANATTPVIQINEGNVGIGTASPGAKLDVQGTILVNNEIQFVDGNMRIFRSSNDMRFRTGGSDKMTILSGGNVGIGATGPTAKLHVLGGSNDTIDETTANFKVQGGGGNGTTFGTIASSPYTSYIQSAYVVDTSLAQYNLALNPIGGNVGIGATSPGAKLEVGANVAKGVLINRTFTTSSQTLANVRAYYGLAITPLRTGTGGLYFTNYDADTPIIQSVNTSDVAQFLLLNPFGGNVGIGTTSPNDKLDVVDGNAQMVFGTASSDRTYMRFKHNAVPVDGEELCLMDFSGYNDASQDTRYVILTAKAEDVTDGSEDGSLTFQTMKAGTATQSMTLRSGNVGIGTISPDAKLEVTGGSGAIAGTGLAYFNNTDDAFSLVLNNVGTSSQNDRGVFDARVGGSSVFRINNSGNVGIGTTSPDGNLEVITSTIVSGASDTVNNVLIGLQAANRPTIILDTADTTYTNRTWNITNVGSAGKLFIGRNGLDVMVMDNSGNVGIGTTSPNQSAAASSSTVVSTKAKTSGGVAITELIGLANNDNDKAGLISFISQNATSALASIRGLRYTSDTTGKLAFFTSGTEKMRIDYNGNVGIGTTAPDSILHVNGYRLRLGDGASDSKLWGTPASGGNFLIGQSSNTGRIKFVSSADSDLVTILNGGNVGIGTSSPATQLHVESDNPIITLQRNNNGNASGALQFRGSDNVVDWQMGTNQVVGLGLEFNFQNSNKVYIETGGNVGIGTTGPQAKLHVYDTAIPSSGDIITNKIYSVGNVTANSNTRTGLDVETTRTGWYNSDSTSGNFKISINNRIGISTLIGVKSLATIDVNNIYSGVSAQGSLIALYGRVTTTFTTGSSPVATAYGLRIDAPEVATNSEIVTYYGAYINGGSVSGTLTNKYALVTEAEAGNVGIGTTSPASKLQVSGSGNESVEIKVSAGTTAGNTGSISLSRTDGSGNIIQGAAFLSGGVPIGGIAGGVVGSSNTSAPAFAIQTPNSANGHIVFNPKGTEKMRIEAGGNVGIGTTSIDASSPKLEVSGSIMSTSSSLTAAPTAASVVMDYHSPSNAGRIMAGSGGSWNKNLSLVPYGGNVGIGTTTPDKLLHVGDGSATLSAPQGAEIEGYNNTLDVKTNEANNISDFTPAINLFCDGVTGSSGTGTGIYFRAQTGGGGGGEYTKGRIQGAVYTSWTTNTDATRTSKLVIQTTNSGTHADRVTILGNGDFGINDTSPSNKLDVNGDIRGTQYKLRGNVSNPTSTAATIYDQSGVGLTLSAHNVELRNYNGSSMVRSVFFTHNTATFTGTCTATNFILSSDEILKDNIKDIDNKHIDVNWKNFELKSEPGIKRAGVIAQELETKHPEFVRTNKDGLKSVAYIDLLIAKIAELEARLEKAGI